MAATRHGGRVLGAHRRPGAPARERARPRRLRQRRDAGARPRAFEAADVKPRGELWAAMLDTRQSWDDLVQRHAPDKATEQAILDNKLYQNFAGRFVQSHDYIAMERLYEIHASGTLRPRRRRHAAHAQRGGLPRRARAHGGVLHQSRFLRLLIAPYRSRLVSMASKPFYQVADRILGTQFLQDIAEFFILFQSMYDGLRRPRTRRVRAAARQAHAPSSSSPRSKPRRCTRPSSSSTQLERPQAAPRRDRAEQGAARRTSSTPSAARDRRAHRERVNEIAEAVAAADERRGRRCARAHRDRRELSCASPSSRNAKPSSAPSWRRRPTWWRRCRSSSHDIADLGGLLRLGAKIWS